MSQICAVCSAPAEKKCSACESVFYCNAGHQKKDWKRHKKVCPAYKVEENDIFGRFLVATRNIKCGSIVITEEPIAIGPNRVSLPVCLGCHTELDESFHKCGECGFPLCSQKCEKVKVIL